MQPHCCSRLLLELLKRSLCRSQLTNCICNGALLDAVHTHTEQVFLGSQRVRLVAIAARRQGKCLEAGKNNLILLVDDFDLALHDTLHELRTSIQLLNFILQGRNLVETTLLLRHKTLRCEVLKDIADRLVLDDVHIRVKAAHICRLPRRGKTEALLKLLRLRLRIIVLVRLKLEREVHVHIVVQILKVAENRLAILFGIRPFTLGHRIQKRLLVLRPRADRKLSDAHTAVAVLPFLVATSDPLLLTLANNTTLETYPLRVQRETTE